MCWKSLCIVFIYFSCASCHNVYRSFDLREGSYTLKGNGLILEYGPGPSYWIPDITINVMKILICKS